VKNIRKIFPEARFIKSFFIMLISSFIFAGCLLEGDIIERLGIGGAKDNPIRLTENVWYNSSMPYFGKDEIWYSFDVIYGATYNIWYANEDYGNYTQSIGVNAYYNDGTLIFESGGHGGLLGPYTITSNKTGTVLLKAFAWRNFGGTFAIVYSKNNTMPDL
jgi:hypothetical protein